MRRFLPRDVLLAARLIAVAGALVWILIGGQATLWLAYVALAFLVALARVDGLSSANISSYRQRPGRTPTQVPIEKVRHRLEARRGERGWEVARESDRRHPLSAD